MFWIFRNLALDWWNGTTRRRQQLFEQLLRDPEPVVEGIRQFIRAGQTPKDLELHELTPLAEPIPATSGDGDFVVLWRMEVTYSPVPGSEMAQIPQAREPRSVVVLLVHTATGWEPRRLIYNLNADMVLEKSGGQLRRLNLYPK